MADNQDLSSRLENRFWRVMLTSAFFSWQSAVIIAFSIIAFAFGIAPLAGWQPFFWLIFGAVGVAMFIAATVTDSGAQQRIIQMLLTEQFNPQTIKNDMARKNVIKALDYYAEIQNLATQRSGAGRMQYQNILHELDDLIGMAYDLGKRIDEFEDDRIINRDRMQARRDLETLKNRLKAEKNEAVQEEIRRAIQFKEIQLENLASVESNVKRADIQMDNVLTQLGAIYAQMKNIGSKSLDSGSSKRLQNEIHDMVMGLQDTIQAIDEIQAQRR